MFLAIMLLLGAAFVFHSWADITYSWSLAVFNQSQSRWYYVWVILKFLSLIAAFIIACILIWRYLP